jgi:hypothetical protein
MTNIFRFNQIRQFPQSSFLSHIIIIFLYLVTFLLPENFVFALFHSISGLLLVFYVVGDAFKKVFKRFLITSNGTAIFEIALSILLSFSFFLCFSALLSLRYLLNTLNLSLMLIGAIIVCDLVSFINFRSKPDYQEKSIRGNRMAKVLAFAPLFFGIFLALLFRHKFIWPSMPGWDLYTYLGGSNWIFLNHGISTIFPVPTGEGIAFPASYLFQILIAALSYVIGVSPYVLFWIAPFVTIPLFGLLIYIVTFSIIKKPIYALFASLIALSISGGDSFLGPQYFFPSTVSIIIFLLIATYLLGFENRSRFQTTLAFAFFLLFYSFYYFPLIVTLPFFLFFLYRNSIIKKWSRNRSIMLSSFALILMITFSWIGSSLLGTETFTVTQKLEMLNYVYPASLLILFALGASIIVWKWIDNSYRDKTIVFLLVYTLSLIVIFFLPPFLSIRSEIFFRSLFAIIASFPIVLLLKVSYSKRIVKNVSGMVSFALNKLPLIFSTFFVILLIASSTQPYISYSENVPFFSNISSDEFSAAEWIKSNTPSSGYILTDPSTGYILRGLTLRNSSTSFIVDGHTPSPKDQSNLTKIIWSFFRETDLSILSNYYGELPEKPEIIVLTTRTTSWLNSQNMNSSFLIPMDNNLTGFSGIEKFSTPFFVLVKSYPSVSIYTITNATIGQVYFDDSFSKGWSSWYLDGAYGYHSTQTASGILNITAQGNSNENAWMGVTEQLPNVSEADFLKIRYRIDVPSYAFEIVLWRSNGDWLIYISNQSPNWTELTFDLTKEKVVSPNKIGILIWTQDQAVHTVEVDYILIGNYTY